jgi:hypothetical protein
MVIIKELIAANIKSLDGYSRSKAAKDIKAQLEAQNITCDRGVMSMLYNELDAHTRELNKETKFSHVISGKTRLVITNDGEDFLRENVTRTYRTDRKLTLTESVRELFVQVEEASRKFLKEPSEARVKAFYRKQRVASSAVFQLSQSDAPEDKTLAENCAKRLEQLRNSVKTADVQAN